MHGERRTSDHFLSLVSDTTPSTPAFIYSEKRIDEALDLARYIGDRASCRLLYSLKASALNGSLSLISERTDGLSASSLFEAKLARETIGDRGTVHVTAPAFRSDEIDALGMLCDYISFNTLSQLRRFKNRLGGTSSYGLRINPEISFVKDDRYDPCRKHSKLGVPIDVLISVLNSDPVSLFEIRGLHFHTNCDSSDFSQLLHTVEHIDVHLCDLLARVEWLNLGGGYLFDGVKDFDAFFRAVDILRSKYDLEVFIEPGAAIVRDTGYLVSTVLDLFESDGKTVAILDTTINHMPEVFEYQFQPDVVGNLEGSPHEYILAGCSCLAGDVFGEYAFEEPLEVGSRVVFSHAGAYTLVKAHMFNGINLPTIYALKEDGKLEMKKRFTYEEFASRCGVETNVFV
ncbi:hypothetical protein MYX82_02220 [Acidobacteria bacterium AH-259-D05]|nr:hypothetical protein [Acidobacteria bacterium AH-259-D05]